MPDSSPFPADLILLTLISILVASVVIFISHLSCRLQFDSHRAFIFHRPRNSARYISLIIFSLLTLSPLVVDGSTLIMLSTLTWFVMLVFHDERGEHYQLRNPTLRHRSITATSPSYPIQWQWQLDGHTNRGPSPYHPTHATLPLPTKPRLNILKRFFLCQKEGSNKKSDVNGLELDDVARGNAVAEDDEHDRANRPLMGISPNPTQATVPNASKGWSSWLRRGNRRAG